MFSAKLNAREATAESEQSLEESNNILLQAQVKKLNVWIFSHDVKYKHRLNHCKTS